MCLLAAGMAMTMTPMTTQLMASVPRDRAGMGSATNDTTRELGGALGVAVLGSLLTSQYSSAMSSVLGQIPEQAREVAEGSLGGLHGLIARGVLPADTPLLEVAKRRLRRRTEQSLRPWVPSSSPSPRSRSSASSPTTASIP